jgi:hypothetical protein
MLQEIIYDLFKIFIADLNGHHLIFRLFCITIVVYKSIQDIFVKISLLIKYDKKMA